jgi:7-carboxy-7-deazaguanine synthase
MSQLPTIVLNEVYGPVIQGEGLQVGQPCFFVRTQGCPVKCPGCDTAYTWDGTEKGSSHKLDDVQHDLTNRLLEYRHCGVVVTGGEPLIHYKNYAWRQMLRVVRSHAAWTSIETSGYIGSQPTKDPKQLMEHLLEFSYVHCSPKITPCLRGPAWESADVNLEWVMEAFNPYRDSDPDAYDFDKAQRLAFKYVVRDEADIAAVNDHVKRYNIQDRKHTVFLMPYGLEAEEVAEGCRRCIEWCAKYGYILSPRLHALLYGRKRAV